MSFVTPFINGMRLGQGYNSYTREVCIDDAVLFDTLPPPAKSGPSAAAVLPVGDITSQTAILTSATLPPLPALSSGSLAVPADPATTVPATPALGAAAIASLPSATPASLPSTTPAAPITQLGINQTVVFASQKVDHIAEVLTTLNISSFASIKYGGVQASGSGALVSEKRFDESNLNYVVSVRVTNEPDQRFTPRMTFNSVKDMKPDNFTQVFGDCFVVDFLEGGEFTALILIELGANSSAKAVNEAVTLKLQTGIPGLTVGAGQSFDKARVDALSDCNVTISASWLGGGTIRSGQENWTIEEVVRIANLFPNLVAQNSQRVSAVLMSYNSLRSFREAQALQPMTVLDYTACKIYAKDLFSAYMAYKTMWEDLTLMMKNPEEYQALTAAVDGKEPLGLDPVSLNLARLEVRDQMARIVLEAESLKCKPDKALMPSSDILDSVLSAKADKAFIVDKLQSTYKFPSLLRARLPRWVGAPLSISDDLWKDGNWTPDEMAAIMKFTADRDRLHFSPPVGDMPKGTKGKAFCTLNANDKDKSPPKLLHVALHGHKHVLGNDLLRGSFSHHSHSSRGALSHIGIITSEAGVASGTTRSSAHIPPCKSPIHFGASTSCPGIGYYSTADVSRGIVRADVGFAPGTGRIASLRLFDRGGTVVLSWNMYSCTAAGWKQEDQQRLETKTILAPMPAGFDDMSSGSAKGWVDGEQNGAKVNGVKTDWELVGFWGRADVVVQQIGTIWGRV